MSSQAHLCNVIPSIFDILTTNSPFTCIEREPKTVVKCTKHICQKKDIPHAVSLWERIKRLSPLVDYVRDLLAKIAESLHCKLHRKGDGIEKSIKSIVDFWHSELRRAFQHDLQSRSNDEPSRSLVLSDSCPPGSYTKRFSPRRINDTPAPGALATPTSEVQPAVDAHSPEFIPFRSRPLADPFINSTQSPRSTKSSFCPKYLQDVVFRKIDSKSADSKPGYLYVFSRDSNRDHVKIGYTTGSVRNRLKEWQNSCKYPPRLIYQTRKVLWAGRLESIVHSHLDPLRRREGRCKWNPNCTKRHDEWFKIPVSEAKDVVSAWESWMLNEIKPYDCGGTLRLKWELHLIGSKNIPDEDKVDAERLPWHHAAELYRNLPAASTPSPSNHTTPSRDTYDIRSYFLLLTPPSSPSPSSRTTAITTSSRSSRFTSHHTQQTRFPVPSPPTPSPPSRLTRMVAAKKNDALVIYSASEPSLLSLLSLFPLSMYMALLAMFVMYVKFCVGMLEWCV